MKDRLVNGDGHADAMTEAETFSTEFETLKLEVINSITRALESRTQGWKGALDFVGERGVDFYEEVGKFEVELIKRALAHTRGNQRAASRLLGLKTTTLNSKVKVYKLSVNSQAA
ncbi:MAG: hypothetical protein H7Z38_22355 [Rubrivivax sp.]|nr:hypothetical protein [Pyrinomonadaceae bacterium]